MATVEQWTGAARNLTDKRSDCLQIVRNIELSLEYVGAMIAKCDSGPNKEFLLKQQRVLEEALRDVKERIRQLFGMERTDVSSSRPRRLTLVAGTDVAGRESVPLR